MLEKHAHKYMKEKKRGGEGEMERREGEERRGGL